MINCLIEQVQWNNKKKTNFELIKSLDDPEASQLQAYKRIKSLTLYIPYSLVLSLYVAN